MKRNAVAWAALIVSAAALISSHGLTKQVPAQEKALSIEGQKHARALSEAFEAAADFVRPSVVQINVAGRNPMGRGNNGPNMPAPKELEDLLKRFMPNFKFEKQQLIPPGGGIGTGSGFVYDDKGHILTNNHVVDGATNIQVTFHDGETAKAKIVGVDPDADQRWPVYLRSVLAFSLVSIVVLYAVLRLQAYLPYSLSREGMPSLQALNTAVSFVTNTNWQSYSGEAALGYTAQMAGLAVQNFLSAAVGIAVAVALVRGLSRRETDRVGNFWVDLTRITLRVLLPLAVVFGVVLLLNGVVQNFNGDTTITTLGGGARPAARGAPPRPAVPSP